MGMFSVAGEKVEALRSSGFAPAHKEKDIQDCGADGALREQRPAFPIGIRERRCDLDAGCHLVGARNDLDQRRSASIEPGIAPI